MRTNENVKYRGLVRLDRHKVGSLHSHDMLINRELEMSISRHID